MKSILIKNGLVVDPANGIDAKMDLLIEDGKIADVRHSIAENGDMEVIDASGKAVMPGFVDLHVHLREPGFEYKETIKTGAMAAARGGVTSLCAMPNTNPVIDTPEAVTDLKERAKDAIVNVLPVGAVTKGQEGKELVDFRGMKEAGAVAFSEDGKSVMDSLIFKKSMEILADIDMPMLSHCEDKALVCGGVMNAGNRAKELGLAGITNAVEDVIAIRDIIIAKETGCRLHLCHCSTADSAEFMCFARAQGLGITAEVCPHHFTLSDSDIKEDHGRFKMNPPLRAKSDVAALKKALSQDIMGVISTDHAPHSEEEKNQSMKNAPFGIVGLETSFALGYTVLVKGGYLTLSELVKKMSLNPSRVINIDRGTLSVGSAADIVIADVTTSYKIDKNSFVSKGKNTPFDGMTVTGRVEKTFVDGKIVFG